MPKTSALTFLSQHLIHLMVMMHVWHVALACDAPDSARPPDPHEPPDSQKPPNTPDSAKHQTHIRCLIHQIQLMHAMMQEIHMMHLMQTTQCHASLKPNASGSTNSCNLFHSSRVPGGPCLIWFQTKPGCWHTVCWLCEQWQICLSSSVDKGTLVTDDCKSKYRICKQIKALGAENSDLVPVL